MSYEIPQQLQHKEKILFGLTFPQLAWALLFGCIDLLILVKGNQSLTVKLSIALIPTTLGILFIFFDVFTWIKHIFYFLRFKTAIIDTPNMKSLVEM